MNWLDHQFVSTAQESWWWCLTDHLNWLYAYSKNCSVSAYEITDFVTSKKRIRIWSNNYCDFFQETIDILEMLWMIEWLKRLNTLKIKKIAVTQKTSLIYNFED